MQKLLATLWRKTITDYSDTIPKRQNGALEALMHKKDIRMPGYDSLHDYYLHEFRRRTDIEYDWDEQFDGENLECPTK